MMDTLQPYVENGVGFELEEARKENGELFNSEHEGYGVILEEATEAGDEIEQVASLLSDILRDIHTHNEIALLLHLRRLEHHATLAACEYIQVAAMARKMKESVERRDQ